MLLDVKNVKKTFGRGLNATTALNGISFTVDKGEFVAIMGESGSGKSTLLNLIATFDKVSEGNITINTQDIRKLRNKQIAHFRRDNLGFVFQFYNLISDLNVLENVEVGKYLSKNPLNIDELLDELGISDHKYKYPNEISGGQAQRASIARAMIKSPKLLICDEPTGALDYESAKDVLCLIEKLNQKYKSTVIIASHNTQIAKMSDVILSLHNGSVKSVVENTDKISAKEVTW